MYCLKSRVWKSLVPKPLHLVLWDTTGSLQRTLTKFHHRLLNNTYFYIYFQAIKTVWQGKFWHMKLPRFHPLGQVLYINQMWTSLCQDCHVSLNYFRLIFFLYPKLAAFSLLSSDSLIVSDISKHKVFFLRLYCVSKAFNEFFVRFFKVLSIIFPSTTIQSHQFIFSNLFWWFSFCRYYKWKNHSLDMFMFLYMFTVAFC